MAGFAHLRGPVNSIVRCSGEIDRMQFDGTETASAGADRCGCGGLLRCHSDAKEIRYAAFRSNDFTSPPTYDRTVICFRFSLQTSRGTAWIGGKLPRSACDLTVL